jgi:hypothetical protein
MQRAVAELVRVLAATTSEAPNSHEFGYGANRRNSDNDGRNSGEFRYDGVILEACQQNEVSRVFSRACRRSFRRR